MLEAQQALAPARPRPRPRSSSASAWARARAGSAIPALPRHLKCTKALFSSTTVFWYKGCSRKLFCFGGHRSHLLLALLLGYYNVSFSISRLVSFPLYSTTLLLHLAPFHVPSFQQDKCILSVYILIHRKDLIDDPEQISPLGN